MQVIFDTLGLRLGMSVKRIRRFHKKLLAFLILFAEDLREQQKMATGNDKNDKMKMTNDERVTNSQ